MVENKIMQLFKEFTGAEIGQNQFMGLWQAKKGSSY